MMRTRHWAAVPASLGALLLVLTGCVRADSEPPDPGEARTEADGAESSPDAEESTGAEPTGGSEEVEAGDFCGELERFYQLSTMSLFGLAFDPSAEVVDATIQAGEAGSIVRDLAPEEVAGDLEPVIVVAENLAEAMDGVDPGDPDAVVAAAEPVLGNDAQDEDALDEVDVYTERECSFTADSVAQDFADGGMSNASQSSDEEPGDALVNCDALDAAAIANVTGAKVTDVEQLGHNENFTYLFDGDEFEGEVAGGCTVDLALKEFGPPEVRFSFATMADGFYAQLRGLAQLADGFTSAPIAGADGFYFQEASFSAVLVADLDDGQTLFLSASARSGETAPDQATMTALAEESMAALA